MDEYDEFTSRIADQLEQWTGELDRAHDTQVYAILGAAAVQLAKRHGPERALTDLHELAMNFRSSARSAH